MNENWWKTHPWRMLQTNLREIDMADIDAEEYVKQLKKFKATVAMINTSGIIASYKTDLPYHFQSPYLTGSSLLEIIEACHREKIKVIARTDFSKVRRYLYEQHPDWAYMSPKGEIIDYNGDVHTCINGRYQQVYALNIMLETTEKLPVDGMFFNMGGYNVRDYSYNYYGICHCDNCKRKFKEMFGLNLPDAEDMGNPTYRKYKVFQRETLKEHADKVSRTLKEARPDLAINRLDIYRQESNTEFGRPLPHWQYTASSNTRFAKGTYPGIISSNTTADFIGFFYRHIAVNPSQQELRLWQNIANGGGVDYYIMGRLDNHQDRSGYDAVRKVFSYHEKNEQYYGSLNLCADILLVHEMSERDSIKNCEYRGWIRFLTEKHFLFNEILTEGLKNIDLTKYKAVILADAKYLSDEDIRRLDEYVHEGGKLISAGESAMHDSDYEPRNEMPLVSVGVRSINIIREDMLSAMLLLEDKKDYPTMEDTDVLYFGNKYIFAEYEKDTEKSLKLIPPHRLGPPERCYYTEVTDLPGFSVNRYGKGKGIFFPWWPGNLFHREGYVNTIDFIGDVLENVVGITPVKTNLPPMVEVTLCEDEQKKYNILHLVNTSGNFGNTFYKPIKMEDIYLRLLYHKAPANVVSLVDGKNAIFKYFEREGILEIKINSLEAFEAFKIS